MEKSFFNKKDSYVILKRILFRWFILWTLVVAISLAVHWVEEREALINFATVEARSNFNKDLVYRQWATSHGGVYVPPTETTPPNPFLARIPDRDVLTNDGKRLTLINPAYMTRQVHELGQGEFGLKGHITSLKPIRPENSPDAWEKKALLAFEKGSKKVSSVETLDGEPYLRFMRPMVTEKGCLKCHAEQGYEVGDIRGGISVSVPLTPYLKAAAIHQKWQAATHSFIWLLGVLGIWLGGRTLFRSQAHLWEEKKQLSLALAGADLGTWNCYLVTGEMTFNERFREILGCRPGDVEPDFSTWRDYVHPADLPQVEKAWKQHYEGKTDFFDVQHRMKHRSGRWVWVTDRGRILERDSKTGVPQRACGTFLDITLRKEAEKALKKSEEKFRSLFESSPEAIFITTPEGRISAANPMATALFGWSEREFFELGWSAFLEEGNPCLLLDERNEGRAKASRGGESIGLSKEGQRFPVEYDAVALQGKPVRSFVIIRDIRQRKQAEAERLELESHLRHAQRIESVGRLAGGVAHDYNNMLSVIIGYTELAKMKTDTSNDLQNDLDEVLAAAKRSRDITQQLLTFARRQTVVSQVLDLNAAIENLLRMLRQLLGENIELIWSPGQQLCPVKMDPSQLDQMLTNLFVNARDAIGGVGKITIETHQVSFDRNYCHEKPGVTPGDYAMLIVTDDGCGMDGETLDRIFEPFFTTKPPGSGTGLGLATVFGLINKCNGIIQVDSEPDVGTTFTVCLPKYLGEPIVENQPPGGTFSQGRGETILLVEDEASILKLVQKMLEDLGYKTLVANSPSEAFALVEACPGKIDLLITDVIMPEMNGRELARRLQNVIPRLKSLYMSGYSEDAIGANGVMDLDINLIQKPFSIEDLRPRIKQMLG